MKKQPLILIISVLLFSCQQKTPADYLIQNGSSMDGLGNPAIKEGLVILNGKIKLVRMSIICQEMNSYLFGKKLRNPY